VPLVDDVVVALLRTVGGAVSALLALLAPRQAERTPVSPLHAALLNVTSDAGRAADLVHEFIAMEADPALQQRFLAFLSLKAATNYARVDQQLSWVLWVYSTLWMPLLIVLCLSRGIGGGSPSSSRKRRGDETEQVHAALLATAPTGKVRGPDAAAAAAGLAAAHGSADWAPLRHSASVPARRAHALDEFGDAAAKSSSVLRRSATMGVRRNLVNGNGSSDGGMQMSSREAGLWDVGGLDAAVSLPSDQSQRPLSGIWGPGGNSAYKMAAAVRSGGLQPVAEL